MENHRVLNQSYLILLIIDIRIGDVYLLQKSKIGRLNLPRRRLFFGIISRPVPEGESQMRSSKHVSWDRDANNLGWKFRIRDLHFFFAYFIVIL